MLISLNKHNPKGRLRWQAQSEACLGSEPRGPGATGASLASTSQYKNRLFVPLSQRWKQQALSACSKDLGQEFESQAVLAGAEAKVRTGHSWSSGIIFSGLNEVGELCRTLAGKGTARV